ncbi:hypothetical protein NB714_004667 [Pantoea dispersa]|nr:hypothetical protein [Pantoea dispersa]MCW0328542.1 hypothetical protein [Pantoea dispersa]MCW0434973.1 hypothetical protein [Pantoea dispersa]
MNTQNVNVKTATPESPKTWVKPVLFTGSNGAAADRMDNAEDEREYWLRREAGAVRAPEEIDVHRYHDALGVMYPRQWETSDGFSCESFILDEMYCGRVAVIYARVGARYFRLRDYNSLNHAQIMTRVKEAFDLNQK